MQDTVDEVGRVAAAEGIDCRFAKGGTVVAARSPVQLARAQAHVARDTELGGVDDLRLLSAEETRERVGMSGVEGGVFTPHCARIHPARLVRGLAQAVERRGGRIAERTTVTDILPGRVTTDRGTVRARVVVRATEGWTPELPGSRRAAVPVYSLMVATQPLPAEFWARAGLAAGETFADERHLIVYGQRTADDRIAFGGRGAPYHFGSRVDPAFDRVERVFTTLRHTLVDLFPDLAGYGFTHAWGGPLAIARDWTASVGLDRGTGLGWAGGYVGDGVGTSNLAGRTLADLVLGRRTAVTRLPWVGHRSRRWEPEPLRWLGLNAAVRAVGLADAEERVTRRGSVIARAMAPLLGE
jgi:glycine/D-amino acid oxidase-like deaminating enzyme